MLVGSRVANIIQCSSLGCLHTYVERQKRGRCGWLGVCGGGQGRTIIMLSTLEEDLVECVVVSDFMAKQAYVYRSILVHSQSTSKDLLVLFAVRERCPLASRESTTITKRQENGNTGLIVA